MNSSSPEKNLELRILRLKQRIATTHKPHRKYQLWIELQEKIILSQRTRSNLK